MIKGYPETHQVGLITIEQEITKDMIGNFGIQIAKDGRIWICINGIAVIRFKPFAKDIVKHYKEYQKKKEK